jgi:Ser-tRNA(Ala) deacylase AlaX
VGLITGEYGQMAVRQVSRTAEGVVHCGKMIEGRLRGGDRVLATIDRDIRRKHARLHTAGETICAAVAALGRRWPVTAASHIPGQSRVAFATDLVPDEVPAFIELLKAHFLDIVRKDEEVLTLYDVAPDEARRLCALDAASIDGKCGPLRLVSPVRDFFRPCLGAHLQRTSEIGSIEFRKARLRHGELSISYELA